MNKRTINGNKRSYVRPALDIIKLESSPVLNSVSSDSGIVYGGYDDEGDAD